jgi:hypothetical protein
MVGADLDAPRSESVPGAFESADDNRSARLDTPQRSADHPAHLLQAGGPHARHTHYGQPLSEWLTLRQRRASAPTTSAEYRGVQHGMAGPAAAIPAPGRESSS